MRGEEVGLLVDDHLGLCQSLNYSLDMINVFLPCLGKVYDVVDKDGYERQIA